MSFAACEYKRVTVIEDTVFEEGTGKAGERVARQIALENDAKGLDDAFALFNLNSVVEQHRRWCALLPRVKPFYAVKCNNDPVLLRILADLGCGFDCASHAEIDAVIGGGLVAAEEVIYANPCKTRSYIRQADKMGVRRMTFDSIEELVKIKAMHSLPQLILRIAVADPTAQCPLATKFGCELEAAPDLLRAAYDHDMELIGISFHVGSGCRDPTAFRRAICASRKLFRLGSAIGHRMSLLDIGGGFPGHDTIEITFEKIVEVVQCALDDFFPEDGEEVEIIAEPGRFFGSSPVSLCTNVIAVNKVPASRVIGNSGGNAKIMEGKEEGYMLYINDGVYGSFNCILFDHVQPRGRPLFGSGTKEGGTERKFPTIVWGQTCDGLDQVEAHTEMRKMEVGEWLFYENMGAYTSVAASNFNGFTSPHSYYIIGKSVWKSMMERKVNRKPKEGG